jgi:argonaute siRNA chaperone (ARC) complex subunit Arb1
MDRMQVFTKYLAYGGIDVGPKAFGGLDNHDLEDLDKEQILLARSQTTIVEERSKLQIDFDTVAKGYLLVVPSLARFDSMRSTNNLLEPLIFQSISIRIRKIWSDWPLSPSKTS